MITFETRQLLRKLLLGVAAEEKKLEVLRQILCEQESFESYAAFRRMDRMRRTFLTSYEILEFLLGNGLQYPEEECELVIRHYDRDDDMHMTYAEFLPALLPMENPDLRTIATQRKVYDVEPDQSLPYEFEYALARLLSREIEYYVETDAAKKELQEQSDFSPYDAFAAIDIYETGSIDFTNLRNFFQSSGAEVPEEDIVSILRRIDRDDNGKLSFDEFVLGIRPHNLTRKQSSQKSRSKGQGKNGDSSRSTIKDTLKKFSSPVKTYLSPKTPRASQPSQSKTTSFSKREEQGYSTLSELPHNATINKSMQETAKRQTKRIKDINEELILVFREIINLDKEAELAKQDLATRADFNLLDAFQIFDQKGKITITVPEVEIGFRDLGLYPSKEDVYLFIKRFDKDGDGYLTFSDFVDAVCPLKNEYHKLVQSRPPINADLQYKPSQVFSKQTKALLNNVLTKHIENEAVVEALRQKLHRNKQFNLKDAFCFFDSDDDTYITLYDLRVAFDRFDVFATEKELYYIIHRLDRDGDKSISYGEFIAGINPKSQKKY